MRRGPGPARLRKPVLEASRNGDDMRKCRTAPSGLLRQLDTAAFDWLRQSLGSHHRSSRRYEDPAGVPPCSVGRTDERSRHHGAEGRGLAFAVVSLPLARNFAGTEPARNLDQAFEPHQAPVHVSQPAADPQRRRQDEPRQRRAYAQDADQLCAHDRLTLARFSDVPVQIEIYASYPRQGTIALH